MWWRSGDGLSDRIFPESIYDNDGWAPATSGSAPDSLSGSRKRCAARRWDEVETSQDSAFGLSGGEQQWLCIARAIAVEPDALLLDEPASALTRSPPARSRTYAQLEGRFTIVIVTHNMQQAARVADRTAFFSLETGSEKPVGTLIEFDDTERIFGAPRDPRTRDYVAGRFG